MVSQVRDPASGKIRMYYTLRWAALDKNGVPVTHTHPEPHMFAIALAESDDGVNFTKPALPQLPYKNALNGANVSASNIIAADQRLSAVWVTDKGPTSDLYWGAVGSGHNGINIWSSVDGIVWKVHSSVPIPDLDGMRGLDTMQSMFYDPGCGCHALYTRLWHRRTHHYMQAYRMVRRASIDLHANNVTRQEIVLQARAALRPIAHHSAVSHHSTP